MNSRDSASGAGAPPPATLDTISVDFPACVAREFPDEFPIAWAAVEATLEQIDGLDLSPLSMHSPGLTGYDWTSYLRCSVARMVRALAAVRRSVPDGARLLDQGAYFGNFSTMFAVAGYEVDAVDAYDALPTVFDPVRRALKRRGVHVMDSHHDLPHGAYDVVVAMGVIEHIPHTPRLFLEELQQRLRPGGLLVLDTPNLAYLYTRQRLGRGESIFCPLALQYYTQVPFEGHHREYTPEEVDWMLRASGHEAVAIETFNYSFYGLSQLAGADLENHRRMMADPAMREVIFATARKPRHDD